jgi:hypothetical protein
MEVLDNITRFFGDDLKNSMRLGARLAIAAYCFSIYAFEALREWVNAQPTYGWTHRSKS